MRTSEEISTDCKVIDAELDRALTAGEATGRTWKLSEQAREHLRKCERCRKLYEWFAMGVPSLEPSPVIYENIQSELKRSLRPVSPQPAPRVLAAQFLVVFLLFASPAIVMMGPAGLHEMTAVQLVGIVSVLVFGAGLLSLSLAWQMTPGSLHRVPPRVAIVSLAAGFVVGVAVLFPWRAPEAFLVRGLTCLKGGLLMAIPAGLLFWLLLRRGRTLGVGTAGATLGAMAGLLGASVLQLTCSRQDAGHLMVWHGGVLIVSIGLGVLAAKAIELLGTRRA